MAWLWTAMRPWAMPILRLAFLIRVEGRQNVPRKGAAILASNHLSALDHIVLPAVTRRTIINISKAEHFDKPLKAWFFRNWGVIRLQRGAGDQAAFEAAKKALREGNLFCIYPEGTRSLDGKLHKGHTGVARLALELHVPVIPVAMKGTFEAKPKGGRTRYFRPTAAIVGAPLDFSAYWDMHSDKAVCRKVTDEVMRAIQRLSGQEYVDEYQYNPAVRSHLHSGADSREASSMRAAPTGGDETAGAPAQASAHEPAERSNHQSAEAPGVARSAPQRAEVPEAAGAGRKRPGPRPESAMPSRRGGRGTPDRALAIAEPVTDADGAADATPAPARRTKADLRRASASAGPKPGSTAASKTGSKAGSTAGTKGESSRSGDAGRRDPVKPGRAKRGLGKA